VPLLDGKELSCDHWFDGFGHTHRFQIVNQEDGTVKVFYNSRRANDALREKLKSTGKYKYTTFGQKKDPCIGIFGKVSRHLTIVRKLIVSLIIINYR
jgi:torulene dioxygenase